MTQEGKEGSRSPMGALVSVIDLCLKAIEARKTLDRVRSEYDQMFREWEKEHSVFLSEINLATLRWDRAMAAYKRELAALLDAEEVSDG